MNLFNFTIESIALSSAIAVILAITLPQIIAGLSTLIGVLFPFFWDNFKGYRTKIISLLEIVIGFMVLTSEDILPAITNLLGVSTDVIVGIFVALLGLFQYLLRLVSDTPAGDMAKFSKRLTGTKAQIADEIQMLRKK